MGAVRMLWKYQGGSLLVPPSGAEGFVYLIHFTDGTKYLGKKSFWSRRKVLVKGTTKKKLVVTESNWKVYRGSSEMSKEKASKGMVESLEVLHLCDSKGALMYLELKELVQRDVLCCDSYLNGNILLKIYRCYKPWLP